MTDRVLLCAKRHNFDDTLALAKDHGLGIEVQTFAFPDALDGDWTALLRHYQAALRDISGPVAMHAPFIDMASGSADPLIENIVRQRMQQALQTAAELRAQTLVCHANYIASMRNEEYRLDWTERQVAFWTPLAEEAQAAGIVIALENMWEYDPDLIGDVLHRADHPGLRACVDVGHAHLFSELPFECWLKQLAGHIVHAHLNNNGGEVDEHRALDQGILDYPRILTQLRSLPQPPLLALEIEHVSDMQRSLSLLDLLP